MEQKGVETGKTELLHAPPAIAAPAPARPDTSTRFSADNQPAVWEKRSRPGGTIGIKCPDCGSPMPIRSSRTVSPLFKELRMQCSNLDCSGSYIGSVTIDRAIVRSATPNARVKLRCDTPPQQRPG